MEKTSLSDQVAEFLNGKGYTHSSLVNAQFAGVKQHAIAGALSNLVRLRVVKRQVLGRGVSAYLCDARALSDWRERRAKKVAAHKRTISRALWALKLAGPGGALTAESLRASWCAHRGPMSLKFAKCILHLLSKEGYTRTEKTAYREKISTVADGAIGRFIEKMPTMDRFLRAEEDRLMDELSDTEDPVLSRKVKILSAGKYTVRLLSGSARSVFDYASIVSGGLAPLTGR